MYLMRPVGSRTGMQVVVQMARDVIGRRDA